MTRHPLAVCARKVAVAIVAAAVALGLAPAGMPASAATTARAAAPRVPAGLPRAIERLADYVPATSCDPVVRRGTQKLGRLLTETYAGTSFSIARACGTSAVPTSEHYDGRAVDWMVSARTARGRARAKAALSWLFARDDLGNKYANARRLGVMYVIWNNRIWGAYQASEGWRAYSSCKRHPGRAYDTTCHRNHMHLSLSWEGATGRTSFWSKSVSVPDYGPCRQRDMNWATSYRRRNTSPCRSYPRVRAPRRASALDKKLTTYSGMRVHRGFSGPAVSAVQDAVGMTPGGTFGAATVRAVARWQRAHHLHGSGVVTIPTWRALLKANAPKPRRG
jgi:peptidoglycan hydrolase-like protein with peptidoglycan-binding domain